MIKFLYCVVLLILGAAIWWAVGSDWMALTDAKEELVKIGLQVLVFGVAGGFVKLLLDSAADRRDFRSEVLRQLGQAHRTVYRVRRQLTMDDHNNPVDPSQSNKNENRAQLLGELMDARQDLGSINHEIRIMHLLTNWKQIRNKIDSMRNYLELVIDAAMAPNYAQSEAYRKFLIDGESGSYQENFKNRFIEAKKLADPSFNWPVATWT